MKKIIKVCTVIILLAGGWGCRTSVAQRPEAVVDVRPAQPGPDYIWIDGDWHPRGGTYAYTNGYWSNPRPGHAWIPGHWVSTRHGSYWVRGHWR